MSFCNSIESHLKYTCTCNIFADVESSTSCWWCGFTIVCSSTDVLTSDEAVSLLKERSKGKHERGETKNWNVLNRMRRAKQIYWPHTIADVITSNLRKFILPTAEHDLATHGYPAYTTSAGWMGYSDEKIQRVTNHTYTYQQHQWRYLGCCLTIAILTSLINVNQITCQFFSALQGSTKRWIYQVFVLTTK